MLIRVWVHCAHDQFLMGTDLALSDVSHISIGVLHANWKRHPLVIGIHRGCLNDECRRVLIGILPGRQGHFYLCVHLM
jgi:hypothetical protein